MTENGVTERSKFGFKYNRKGFIAPLLKFSNVDIKTNWNEFELH